MSLARTSVSRKRHGKRMHETKLLKIDQRRCRIIHVDASVRKTKQQKRVACVNDDALFIGSLSGCADEEMKTPCYTCID